MLWIDEDIVESLRDLNLNVKEVNELDRIMRGSNEDRKREVEQDRKLQKELAGINRYSLEFKAILFETLVAHNLQMPMCSSACYI